MIKLLLASLVAVGLIGGSQAQASLHQASKHQPATGSEQNLGDRGSIERIQERSLESDVATGCSGNGCL